MAWVSLLSDTAFLLILVGIPMVGMCRRIKVYESFIRGAQGAFPLVVDIVPYFIAMLVVIGMLRASGFFAAINDWVHPVLAYVGMPDSILPMLLLRPFSGSASLAVLADIIHQHGANSFDAFFAATALGSSETTFYVVAVYFGAVNVVHTRYAIAVGLIADISGFFAAAVIAHLFFHPVVSL